MKLFTFIKHNINLSNFSDSQKEIIEKYNSLIKDYYNKYNKHFHIVSIIDNDSKEELKDNSVLINLLKSHSFLNNLMFPGYAFYESDDNVNTVIDTNINKVEKIL